MKVLLGILAVVGLLAGVFILFSGPSFGAGSDAPLGKFDKVDEFLQEGELEKAKPGKGDVKRLLGETIASRKDLIIWKYIGRAPGYPHFILVAAKRKGRSSRSRAVRLSPGDFQPRRSQGILAQGRRDRRSDEPQGDRRPCPLSPPVRMSVHEMSAW